MGIKNPYCNFLCNSMLKLLKSNDYCDATLLLNGSRIKAHSVVLAAASPKLKEMIDHLKFVGKPVVLEMSGCTEQVADVMLEYLYTGSMNDLEDEPKQWINLINFLKTLKIPLPDSYLSLMNKFENVKMEESSESQDSQLEVQQDVSSSSNSRRLSTTTNSKKHSLRRGSDGEEIIMNMEDSSFSDTEFSYVNNSFSSSVPTPAFPSSINTNIDSNVVKKIGSDLIKKTSLLQKLPVKTFIIEKKKSSNDKGETTSYSLIQQDVQNSSSFPTDVCTVIKTEVVSGSNSESINDNNESTYTNENDINNNDSNVAVDGSVNCDANDDSRNIMSMFNNNFEVREIKPVSDGGKEYVDMSMKDEDTLASEIINEIISTKNKLHDQHQQHQQLQLQHDQQQQQREQNVRTIITRKNKKPVSFMPKTLIPSSLKSIIPDLPAKVGGSKRGTRGPYKTKNKLIVDLDTVKLEAEMRMNKELKCATYECTECHRLFITRSGLANHIASHGHVFKAYSCPVCQLSFKYLNSLRRHAKDNHDLFVCPECGVNCVCSPEKVEEMKRKDANPEQFICQECGKVFNSSKAMGLHLQWHHRKAEHVCDKCGRSFKFLSHLTSHAITHGQRMHKCQMCHRSFVTQWRLDVHQRMHTQQLAPYICKSCNARFNSPYKLKIHSFYHKNESYKCNLCDKTMRNPFTLKNHLRIHQREGEKKTKECSLCGKFFYDNVALHTHMKTHDDFRPHQCNLCGRAFKMRSHLRYHMNSHNDDGPIDCETCGATFKKKYRYRRHLSNGKCRGPGGARGKKREIARKKKATENVGEYEEGESQLQIELVPISTVEIEEDVVIETVHN